jgi:hypothetical protein
LPGNAGPGRRSDDLAQIENGNRHIPTGAILVYVTKGRLVPN